MSRMNFEAPEPETDSRSDTVIDLRSDGSTVADLTAATADLPEPPKRVNPFVALAAVGALAAVVISGGSYRVLLVALSFGAMILLHELGHFVTARLTGMKATEFFVGFGPRVWSFKRGGTEYGIKALPLGGYVKILGMHNLDRLDDPADEPRTYRQATFPRRVLVASAGTLMHMLIAFVIFVILYSGTGRLIDTDNMQIKAVSATVGSVASPASAAGLQNGDRIYTVNGYRITGTVGSDGLTDLLRVVQSNPGTPLEFGIVRNKSLIKKTIVPATVILANGATVGRIGVTSDTFQVIREPVVDGVGHSVSQIWKALPQTFSALGAFFTPRHLKTYGHSLVNAGGPQASTGTQDPNRFMSLPGTVNVLADASRVDIRWALELFAVINVFVGVFNMLPVLPLDGGHVLIAFYERLRSRKGRRYRVDVAKLMPLTYAVVTILIVIGISSLYLDIRNPLKLF